MSVEKEPTKEFIPQFIRLQEILKDKKTSARGMMNKETKFGKVDVQLGFEGTRILNPGEFYIEVQVFTEYDDKDDIYTRFSVYSDHIEVLAEKGGGLRGEKIEPQFTLDELLAEL